MEQVRQYQVNNRKAAIDSLASEIMQYGQKSQLFLSKCDGMLLENQKLISQIANAQQGDLANENNQLGTELRQRVDALNLFFKKESGIVDSLKDDTMESTDAQKTSFEAACAQFEQDDLTYMKKLNDLRLKIQNAPAN